MHGAIAWFTRNSVAANLLLFIILICGIMVLGNGMLTEEIFPEFSADIVTVSVVYRGAAPEEVEEGVVIKIEEAIQDLDGIKEIRGTAAENQGSVTVEAIPGYDTRKLLDEIKSRVDAIDTFPVETERPVIAELTNRQQVVNVSIYGDTDPITLKRLAEKVRDDLLVTDGITQAELANAPEYEISVEVSEEALRRYGLTFQDVANAIRRSSLDLPGGSIKTSTGEILLRTKGQAYTGKEFERLTLLTKTDGTTLAVGDVATVVDGFADTDQTTLFNGKRAMLVRAYRVGAESAIDVSALVHDYVEKERASLPPGIEMTIWQDAAEFLRGRLGLLIKNAQTGVILVFIVLTLFLRLRLAFWVTLGIPVSFLGAIAFMPVLDVSINMLSLFSFILVLGIVVDDAIVVGESIYAEHEAGANGVEAAFKGSMRVAVPVIFGVLTTVAAFAPMLFLPGYVGKIWRIIPCIVIPTLLFSLVESKLILPAHLSHLYPKETKRRESDNALLDGLYRVWDGIVWAWDSFFGLFSGGLSLFIRYVYQPILSASLRWRYATISVALAVLLVTYGWVQGGRVGFVFFPQVEGDVVYASLTLPLETPAAVTAKSVEVLRQAADDVREDIKRETGVDVFRHVLTAIGDQPFRLQTQQNAGGPLGGNFASPNAGEVGIELVPNEERPLTADDVVRRWRDKVGTVPGAVELVYVSSLLSSGKDIEVQFASNNIDQLQAVAQEVKAKLSTYPGVYDITDSFRGGKPEVKLDITQNAEVLGLSLDDLARQVRQGFYGEEAQRIQRGRDDVRVMVRYPERRRESLGDLTEMRIRTPNGGEVPFNTVAKADFGRGFSSINRVNRQRIITVSADVDTAVTTANEVYPDLLENFVEPMLATRHSDVAYSIEGEQKDQMETLENLFIGFGVALFVIYALMAIPFKSYVQPLIVMSAVPFGIVGAVWGHAMLGLSMSILSMLGVVALAGVVVNDSLVLVAYINDRRRSANEGLFQAVSSAGVVRFRPILLTSLTTAAGITPLILEKSVQAQFLIPMAVSLAAGILFSTFVTLLLVPSIYLILEDVKSFFAWMATGEWREVEVPRAREEIESAPEMQPELEAGGFIPLDEGRPAGPLVVREREEVGAD